MNSNSETLVTKTVNFWAWITTIPSETWIVAFVAVCALGVTVWQGRQNYKHNRMSVRPQLAVFEYSDTTETEKNVWLELVNSGIGPAIIKDFILLYDGKEVSKNNYKTYKKFLDEKAGNGELVYFAAFVPSSIIPINRPIKPFSFRHKHGQDNSFIEKLNFYISYQSIYEDEILICDTRKSQHYRGNEDGA